MHASRIHYGDVTATIGMVKGLPTDTFGPEIRIGEGFTLALLIRFGGDYADDYKP
jgi:hypothetical protein